MIATEALSKSCLDAETGVLLIGHGTRDPRGTNEFLRQATLLEQCVPAPVQASFLEFQTPNIADAWRMLVDRGVRRIAVTPLLLFAAGHAKSDIPSEIRAVSAETPQIEFSFTKPLSRSRSLVECVLERLGQRGTIVSNTRKQMGPTEEAGLLMVGRGSHDPCARTDMLVLSELIRHRTKFADVRTSFYAMAQPRLPDVLAEMAASGLTSIRIHAHLLFNGRLYEAIIKQSAEVAARYPAVGMEVGPYLGPSLKVAQSLVDRIDLHNGMLSWRA
ncbi:MAG: sirohydrochlorin chelatase [Planctomycetota bacterium]